MEIYNIEYVESHIWMMFKRNTNIHAFTKI
jgi:hypothetical protein